MYKNQLGRRNLTELQKRYLLGKLYEARRNTHGGSRGNQYSKVPTDGKRRLADKTGIRKEIADELGVGTTQVFESFQFSKGIDAIKAQDPETAESILKSELKVKKKNIQEIGKAKPEEQKAMIKAIKGGEPIPKRTKMHDGASKQNREDRAKIRSIVV